MALFVEDMYQRCWQASTEKRFANQQKGKFGHQVTFILESQHGGNPQTDQTKDKISTTMVEKQLGTFNPAVREAGNAANRGKIRTREQKLRIQAGTAMSHLRRGRFSRSKSPLTVKDKDKLWSIIEEAQRLGVYTVPSSEGKREDSLWQREDDIVCSAEKSAAEVSPRAEINDLG